MSEPRSCETCGEPVVRDMPTQAGSTRIRGKVLDMLARAPVYCDRCIDAFELERESEEAQREKREHERRVERWRASSGIPERRRGLTLTDPDHGDALEAATRWAAGEIRGLLLAGPVGVGKTHMAAAAAWRRLERGRLRWFSVPVLFAHLALDFANPLHEAAVEALMGSGTLVLDDVDKARPKDYPAEQILMAIDQRVDSGAALLITTNLTLDELEARFPEPFGEAIADRLGSYCESFHLAGESRRRLGGVG